MKFIAAGDRMFLGMQDFDFFPDLIIFNQIYPNLHNFTQICTNCIQNYLNFAKICLKKFARGYPLHFQLLRH